MTIYSLRKTLLSIILLFVFSLNLISCTSNVLSEPAKKGDYQTVKQLLDAGLEAEVDKGKALVLAAQNGHIKIVELLLSKGVDVNTISQVIRTHIYLVSGSTALNEATKNGHIDIVKLLLSNGANISQTNIGSAATKGHVNIMRLLLPKATTKSINSALITASKQGHLEMVKFLISHDADINYRIKFIHSYSLSSIPTAFRYKHNDIVKYLISSLAHTDPSLALIQASKYGYTDFVKSLVTNGAPLNTISAVGESALFGAALAENNLIAEYLLQSGANILPTVVDNEERENYVYTTAGVYKWYADFYAKKQQNKKAVIHYKFASDYFKDASTRFKKKADIISDEITSIQIKNALKILLVAVLAQKQAQMQANQSAKISAMNSPSGIGRGYGYASTNYSTTNTSILQQRVNLLNEKYAFANKLYTESIDAITCHKNHSNNVELQQCKKRKASEFAQRIALAKKEQLESEEDF